METIKSYLENMFASLPKSMEVERAKNELYQMMEDKYHELKAEGKSENEAIGIVIAEFGNIEEIKEELGISNAGVKLDDLNENKEERKNVSMIEAKDYLENVMRNAKGITLATMLCIFSPIMLIFLGGLSAVSNSSFTDEAAGLIGLLILLLLIIVAVAIFIYTGSMSQKYEYLKNEILQLDVGTERYLRDQRESEKSTSTIKTIIGVIICILSIVPLFVAGFLFDNIEIASILSVCILLFMVSVSMIFFIPSGMKMEGYKVLLQEDEYKKKYKGNIIEAIASIYWPIAVAVYLGWSFLTMNWSITWIVWPIAGILYGGIAGITGILTKEK